MKTNAVGPGGAVEFSRGRKPTDATDRHSCSPDRGDARIGSRASPLSGLRDLMAWIVTGGLRRLAPPG